MAVYALCEIGGQLGTCGHAAGRWIGEPGYALGRLGRRAEYWAAQRREWYPPLSDTERGDAGVSEDNGPRGEREGLADELAAREDRRRELAAMSKAALCRMYRAGVRTPSGGVSRWVGGMYPPEQWEKNEVISSILDIEYRRPETAPGE